MKAVMLCGPGANQRALAHRLHRIVPLTEIAAIGIPPSKAKRSVVGRLVSITAGRSLRRAWFDMLAHCDALHPGYPDVPISTHMGVNGPGVIGLIERVRPDVVLVSGTNLLKAPLIAAIGGSGRILNLHTGLSPYIKGGPNCTNWALALGEFDLIGNTIMWLDAGIDSGNIAATERTPLTGSETASELHIKVMDHAHDLYGRCLARLRDGLPLPSVPQADLDEGRLFLTKHWTGGQIVRAAYNFDAHYDAAALSTARELVLVAPDSMH